MRGKQVTFLGNGPYMKKSNVKFGVARWDTCVFKNC